jgi:hypothetical protein
MVILVQFILYQFHQHLNINEHHGMLNVVRVQWQQLIHQELIKIKKWYVELKNKKIDFPIDLIGLDNN